MPEQVMRIEPIDLTQVLKDYENKWVVLSDDRSKVLASANTLSDILAYAHLGSVMNVVRFDVSFSPSC